MILVVAAVAEEQLSSVSTLPENYVNSELVEDGLEKIGLTFLN
jgi:hypothetical protein